MIYLDNGATTPLHSKVLEKMMPYLKEEYGNSASLHSLGRNALEILEKSRENILKKLETNNHKLIFTSGGTESNNFALKGIAFANKQKGNHIITTKIEHDCVLNSCKWLEKQGFEIDYLNVDEEGFINFEELESKIKKETLLVSVIHGNNEIGTVQDLKEIGKICHEKETLLHSDACQSFTKSEINLEKNNVDLITINAHKIYGPKGVGGLAIKEGIKIEPLLHGGEHEYGYRSGTVNVPGVVGFSEAINIIKEEDIEHMKNVRNYFIEKLQNIKDIKINGSVNKRLCNNVNVSFKGAEGESIILWLDSEGIKASTGSACSSNTLKPSHVLSAIGLKNEDTHGTVRFTLGINTTKEKIDFVMEKLENIIEKLRSMSPVL